MTTKRKIKLYTMDQIKDEFIGKHGTIRRNKFEQKFRSDMIRLKAKNLQLRKLDIIRLLLGIQDEKLFSKIESNIHKSIKSVKPCDIVFTKQEIMERALFSDFQIKKGSVFTQKELKIQSKKW